MTRYIPIWSLALFLILAACGTPAGIVAEKVVEGDFTDRAISRLAAFNDRVLGNLEKIQTALDAKQERLDRAKCLFPLPALIRYASKSAERRQAVAEDCGVVIDLGIVVTAPAAEPAQ